MTLVIAPAVNGTENKAKPIQGDTLLVYLVDRSGSMALCWEPTIGGLNEDLKIQQKNDDGNTEAAFYFFDSSWGTSDRTRIVKPFEGPLNEAVVFDMHSTEYGPSGGTPLYDSVGKMITEVRERVAATADGANVLVSIFTDGGNTDHHGYSADQVKFMVEECEGQGWTFAYFGANQDAWSVGSSFGIKAGNTMSYDTGNMAATMSMASVARSTHINNAKMAYASGTSYTSDSYFKDAGQTEEDYKKG